MYEISPATYKAAKYYNLDIYPSEKRFKKIDVYRKGEYLASVGDSRYKDYHIYLKQDGKQVANERRRLFHLRTPKDTFKIRLLKLLLWWDSPILRFSFKLFEIHKKMMIIEKR